MKKRVPHTWRFYRKRYRGFCRRMVWVLALLVLGIAGGVENGSLPVGLSILQMCLISLIILYCYGVGYGFARGGAKNGR